MKTERFDEKLIKLLKTNPDFVDDTGELLRDKIKILAWEFDHSLINLLLSDPEIESKFFEEVNGRWIFNNNTFVDYINDKNFLSDSYTQLKNKIGLNIDNRFLRERGEVALVWPYKDCVLEGGQMREEEKRQEIFFNELLAQDEINRMLDPKLLTNWKRHTVDGERNVTDIQRDENGIIRENFIIKGNNLIALHCLKHQFRGQIKLIYIDPPYNPDSPSNTFRYNNKFNHSTWLTFMKNRLEVAKELITTDGFIVIAIDHNELFYLGVLTDEVFGRNNRLATVSVVHQARGNNMDKGFSNSNEFMLVYVKTAGNNIKNVVIDEEKKKEFNMKDEKGNYYLKNYIMVQGGSRGCTREDKPDYWYPIYVSNDLSAVSLEEIDGYEEVLPITNTGREMTWVTKPDTFLKRFKNGEVVIKREGEKIVIYRKFREQQIITTHWGDPKYNATSHGTLLLEEMLGRRAEGSYPKSLNTVLDILKLTTDSDDIILDFFAGTGTTGHAVLELNRQDGGNRQFVLVEQLEEHVMVCKERLEKVIAQNGIMGQDFLSCELMPYNEAFMERIQSAEYSEELFDILDEMSSESFLNWYLKPEFPEEAADYFISIDDVDKQKELLAELLDKNQLYVHLSEIEDEKFDVSGSDKALNRDFYGGDDDA